MYRQPVWPDFAKICNFGIKIHVFYTKIEGLFSMGQKISLHSQKYAFGQIYIIVNGQKCLKPSCHAALS